MGVGPQGQRGFDHDREWVRANFTGAPLLLVFLLNVYLLSQGVVSGHTGSKYKLLHTYNRPRTSRRLR